MPNKKIDIPTYIVNLKKDIEKKEHIQKLCKKYDLYPEFIDAVDGRLLSEEDINEVYSRKKAISKFGRELSRGEIGCALSHKNIYEKMLSDNIEIALVLEDDISFDEELVEIMQKDRELPLDWNLVLLGHHAGQSRDLETRYSFWEQKKLTKTYKLTRPIEKGYGTYGYLIKKNAAKILLNEVKLIDKPIDHYTGSDEKLNLYLVSPAVIKINQHLSDNHHSMEDRTKLDKQLRTMNLNKAKVIVYSRKRKALIFLHLDGIWDSLNGKYINLKHYSKRRRRYE